MIVDVDQHGTGSYDVAGDGLKCCKEFSRYRLGRESQFSGHCLKFWGYFGNARVGDIDIDLNWFKEHL